MLSRARPELRIAVLAAIAVACFLVLRGGSSPAPPASLLQAGSLGLVGDAHPHVSLGELMVVVLRLPSVAQRLAPGRLPTEQEEQTWVAEDDAAQQQVLTELASHGLGARPEYSFARVLDGFSARLGAQAVALLEHDPEIAGVYPVPGRLSGDALHRRAPGPGAASRPASNCPEFDGSGVSIAPRHRRRSPHCPTSEGGSRQDRHRRGAAGAPALTRREATPARPRPRHGSLHAGLLVGAERPRRHPGVAPGATMIPIRVAGWQPDGYGGEALYGRSDQLIAGLDRAVDPSGAGDVQSAARIALVGVAEPFDGFADSPEAQAVRGALSLGTLVVAPAGNDGVAGPWYGSIGGPGGSPAALTVGAVDGRPVSSWERLVVRPGPRRGQRLAPAARRHLLGCAARASARARECGLRCEHRRRSSAAAAIPSERSTARSGRAPRRASSSAARRPSGRSGGVQVPVLRVSTSLARTATALAASGVRLSVPRRSQAEPNPSFPGFLRSRRGLAFDGLVDPELSAPESTSPPPSHRPRRAPRRSAGRARLRRPWPAPPRCSYRRARS